MQYREDWQDSPRERWRYIGENTDRLRYIFEGCDAPRNDDEIAFHRSKLWRKLTPWQRARSVRAYALDSYDWGSVAAVEQGELLGLDTVKPFIHGGQDTAVILSGAYGAAVRSMLGKRHKQEVSEILGLEQEKDALSRLVKLGGAAYCFTQEWPTARQHDMVSFDYVDEARQERVHTNISATLHGDFRTSQYASPSVAYVTPTGERMPFGPVGEEAIIPFYHSSELGILTALLLHQLRRGVTPEELLRGIASELEVVPESRGYGSSMFGDFGSDTMAVRQAAEELHFRLQDGDTFYDRDSLYTNRPYLHMGDDNRTSHVRSTEAGVHFVFEDEGRLSDNDEFIVPNEYINRYVAYLASQEFGRTDIGSMRMLIRAAGMGQKAMRKLFWDDISKSYTSTQAESPLE